MVDAKRRQNRAVTVQRGCCPFVPHGPRRLGAIVALTIVPAGTVPSVANRHKAIRSRRAIAATPAFRMLSTDARGHGAVLGEMIEISPP